MRLEKGRKYRVVKEGAHLFGWKPSGPYCQTGCRVALHPGDELEYLGFRYSGGSDGIDLEAFKLVSRDDPDAVYCTEFRPMVGPTIWDTAPQPGYLELVEEKATV